MKYEVVKIVSNTKVTQFWCKSCRAAVSEIYKNKKDTWCEHCVPEEIKDIAVAMSQTRELL